MGKRKKTENPPVILLCNVDPSWDEKDRKSAERQAKSIASALRRYGNSTRILTVRNPEVAETLANVKPDTELVFNWCESIPGIRHSEAMVAEILESLNIAFTGAPSETIKLCADKTKVKMILQKEKIPTPRWRVFKTPDKTPWNIFPAIIKPALEHGSTGVTCDSIVRGKDELRARVRYMIETFQQPVLVEEFIDGREFLVSVIGNGPHEVFPPVEMDFSSLGNPRDRIYSYDAKYTPGTLVYEKTEPVCPTTLTTEEIQIVGELSKHIFTILGCRDYARIDFRLKNGTFFALDVNPNCDIHMYCAFATGAREAGNAYGQLLDRITGFARHRHAARKHLPQPENGSPS